MKKIIFIFSCLTVIASACNNTGWKTTTNGLEYRIIDDQDTGKTIKIGDIVTFQATFKNAQDSILMSSTTESQPYTFEIPEPSYKGCLYEGWTLLSEGDSAEFKVLSDSLYLKTLQFPEMPPYVKSGETISVSFRIIKVQTKAEAEAGYNAKRAEMMAEMDKKFEVDAKEAKEYVDSKMTNATAHPTGFYYNIDKEGKGELIQTGDKVKLFYTSSFLDGKVAEANDPKNAMELIMGRDPMIPVFIDALPMMKEGSEWTMVVPSKYAYGDRGFGDIPPFTPLIFKVRIEKVIDKNELMSELKKTEEKEPKVINEYLSKPENKGFKQTETGLYYLVLKSTDGAQPKAGEQVSVHYTGTFLDGKKFDSSVDRGQPFQFTVGQGQVISGWDEALQRMKVGEKYKLVLPSKLAYGPTGNSGIPPYTPLVFEVELISIGFGK